jgi:hypothetical protein
MRYIERLAVFSARCLRAWRYYTRLRYSWRLSWAKAGWSDLS